MSVRMPMSLVQGEGEGKQDDKVQSLLRTEQCGWPLLRSGSSHTLLEGTVPSQLCLLSPLTTRGTSIIQSVSGQEVSEGTQNLSWTEGIWT